jgi:O-antigen ligase
MSMGNRKIKAKKDSSLQFVLSFSAAITLYFNSQIQDPFNSPKLWLLLILAAILVNSVLFSIKNIKSNAIFLQIFLVVGLMLLAQLVSALATDDKYIAFFGDSQRKLGFLTYFCLAIIFLFVMVKVNYQNYRFALSLMSFLGLIFAIYGQIQSAGEDFVSWNNPYNSIIGTLGNPNYAAAFLAIMGVVSFGLGFSNSINMSFRISAIFNSVFILYTIYLSNARQGLISYILGVSIILIFFIYGKSKVYGLLAFGTAFTLGVISVLGMLQIGPLTSVLYKNSVTIRGYYWSAGMEMFKSNPFFGVGSDSYGYYFKQYRDVNYPLKYGFDITSTNAHNVFIQFFATGGILVGITYIFLTLLILRAGLGAIKHSPTNHKPFVVALFASWVSFQAQSVISIDNIGLTVWGWLLGGIIVGLNYQSKNQGLNPSVNHKSTKSFETNQLINLVLSTALVLGSIVLISEFYKGEKNAFNARIVFDSNVQEKNRQVYRIASETYLIRLNDPTYNLASAYYMASSGFKDEGIQRLRAVIQNNPRNYDALDLLASIYEQYGLTNEAVESRIAISKLDPWNAKNYLKLGKLYKFQGNYDSMTEVKNKILSFASATNEGEQANLELID